MLEEKGLIGRFYGGAAVDPRAAPMDEEDEAELYRQLMARCAASLTAEGDHVFINGSSTALCINETMISHAYEYYILADHT